MSCGYACHCEERHRPVQERRWFVRVLYGNFSRFHGGRFQPSDYSEIVCAMCRTTWRTKARYVTWLPRQEPGCGEPWGRDGRPLVAEARE